MRKLLVLLIMGMLAASLVVFFPGCGSGNKEKAKEYINAGDRYALEMSSEGDELGEALDDFFTTLQGSNPESAFYPSGPYDRYSSSMGGVNSAAESAVAEYEKVLDLSGVEQEAEYATTMVNISEKTMQLMDTIKVWFEKVIEVIMTRDEAKIRAYLTGEEFEDGMAEIEDMRAEIDELASEAQSYRLDLDI